ncbi:unnamed protein product [Effrenium voratum]|uniref:Carrier domain-containing protein n=1 Tax=Effrenium voratum TaxID=2562239 RepID=A0AA36MWN2_9DINO|nr:unnamed protein product [Effrenium voratum]CAJ1426319.1 unnamed protein product [Effrenium voratum]CAJ1452929.1 unnamed protein product [Effrenium voratum]
MRFQRWDRALKVCMDKTGAKNRWDSDPMILNQEAHELPPDKQRLALDFAEEAPADLKAKLAPMWKFCFVQWHIYDAGLEAEEKGTPLAATFQDPDLLADVESLRVLSDSGDLDQAATTEEWTWKMLHPLPEAGSMQWNDEVAADVIHTGKEERHEGVIAFNEEHFDKAFWHFYQGQKLLAGAPGGGPVAKLRSELLKNKSAAALRLGLARVALGAANAALGINQKDDKAWYRKSCALEALKRDAEARQALAKAGLSPPPVVAARKPRAKSRSKVKDLKELDPLLLPVFEELVFVEVGFDSILAVDLVRHLQAELPGTLSLSLIYDCPTVGDAISELLLKINARKGDYLRRKLASSLWRAMTEILGKDPLKQRSKAQQRHLLTEIQALDILSDLQEAYEDPQFLKVSREVARQAGFDQRSFLVKLRPRALERQKPLLRRLGYPADFAGMRDLEAAVIHAAKSTKVREKLKAVRVALQGGENGMWTINVEQNPVWSDSSSMQLRAVFTKSDPFGAAHINTNAVSVH